MEYKILNTINSPNDVKKLSDENLIDLCDEIRHCLINTLSKTGGHLSSNLGVVELTVALHKVFDLPKDKLLFDVGEFDMVIFNPETASCEIYEIKHSKEIVPQQAKHLLDEKKCMDTEFRYGTITGKYVLYRGDSQMVGNVQYLNVEEYLKMF